MHPETYTAVPQQIHEARRRIEALEEALLAEREEHRHTQAQRDTARQERDSIHDKLTAMRDKVRTAVERSYPA